LDDSVNKINGAAFFGNELIAQRQFVVENNDSGLGRLVKVLKSFPGEVRCVYEAGINGYFLQRYLQRHRLHCDIAAASLTPRRSGKRVKTDRLDAKDLARYYRSGDLTLITIPDQDQEDLRDLMRARENALEDLQQSRHQLHRFLARRGIKFSEGKLWTGKHLQWIRNIHFDEPKRQLVLDEYRNAVVEKMERLKRFDEEILLLAKLPEYQPQVDNYMALKGIKEITAMTIMAEGLDLRRFPRAPGFMAAVGIIPSERSSGEQEIRGRITKTGNSHLRRVLIESAWHYQHRSVPGKSLKKRRSGIRPEVLEIAKKADSRLGNKYWRLIGKGKSKQKTAVAVARELAGFIWAIGQIR
jgi:transposase